MLKRYFMTGVLVWVPILVTLFVMRFLWDLVTSFSAMIPMAYQPNWMFPGFELIFVFLVVWLTGLLAGNVMGSWVIGKSEKLLAKIPLVRSVYQGVKQAMGVLFGEDSKERFSQVVLLEYPRKGVWSMAFVTNDGLPECTDADGKAMLSVFIPTTPNPTSGYILMVPESDVKPVNMSVDAALKYIITLGTVLPEQAD